jgi:hypothetical protein
MHLWILIPGTGRQPSVWLQIRVVTLAHIELKAVSEAFASIKGGRPRDPS